MGDERRWMLMEDGRWVGPPITFHTEVVPEARVAELERENARLREALEEWIAARGAYEHWPSGATMSQALKRVRAAQDAARQALAEEDKQR